MSSAATYLNKEPGIAFVGRSISQSTIHRFLQWHTLRPHLVKYYRQISDPLFFPKMDHLIQLFTSRPDNLFSFDEAAGIQALERIGMPINDAHGTRIESEYKRHGSLDLFAVLHVSTGKIFTRIADNHRQETLTEFFSQHVQMQGDGEVLHYVCDNLAAHSTELFCRKVADLSGVTYPCLKTAPERRQWLQNDDKRIIIHFTPYHGSWLNMVEIWFAILHSRCLKGLNPTSVSALENAILSFSETWNHHFAHPFNWKYQGQGLAQKVVRRLCEWILLEADVLKPKFLDKELLLMMNLAQDYWSHVSGRRWLILRDLLLEKQAYLDKLHRKYADAQGSLTDLVDLISANLKEKPETGSVNRDTSDDAHDQARRHFQIAKIKQRTCGMAP